MSEPIRLKRAFEATMSPAKKHRTLSSPIRVKHKNTPDNTQTSLQDLHTLITQNPDTQKAYTDSLETIRTTAPELSVYKNLDGLALIAASEGKALESNDLKKIKDHCLKQTVLNPNDIKTLLDKYHANTDNKKIDATLIEIAKDTFTLPEVKGYFSNSTAPLPQNLLDAGIHFTTLQDIIQSDNKDDTKHTEFVQNLKEPFKKAYDISLANIEEKYKADPLINFISLASAVNEQSLSKEDIGNIIHILNGKANITPSQIENITKHIMPEFKETLETHLNTIVKLNQAHIITKELNDIIQDGKINDTKLNDFIGKLGNGTKTHYDNSVKILEEHQDNSFLKFLCASAAVNNKTLEKEDIKLFTDSIMPEALHTKLNKDLSEAEIKTLISKLENKEEIPKEIKSKFEKALTSDEQKQFTNVINSKKALTPDAINKFCEKYMESKIHDIIKKTSNNIFDLKKILDTKEHKLDPKESEALDKEIVGDGKNQIPQAEWDKLSDEDKHKKRLDQKLKNEFKQSLPPEEQEKFDKLPPEEQKKMMQEKLGDNMSPEQQLELLEQRKNAQKKHQNAYQNAMQTHQDGEKTLMESQIDAYQKGITGAVSSINKAVQGLTQLASAVSQLRDSTLRAAQQNSESQARTSAQNQQRMQQPMGGMMGQGQGYGMY